MTEIPDMSIEIARRTSACWARIRRYSQELYGQPKVALSLKTRMVKAEAIEALLYGCSTWTLRQEHYAKLRTVHHRVLLCIIGAQRKRPDHRMTSYNRALEITGCESIETTLRTPLPTPRDPPPFLHRGTDPPSYTTGPTPLPTPRDPPPSLHHGTHPPSYNAGPTLLPTPRDSPPFLHRGTHPSSYNAAPRDPPPFLQRGTSPPPYTAGPTLLPTPRDPPLSLHRGTHPPFYTAGSTPLHTPRDPPSFLHRGPHPPHYTAGPNPLTTAGPPPPPSLHRGTHLTKTTILRPFLDSSTRFTLLYVYPRRFRVTPTPPRTAPYPRSPPFTHTSTSALLGRSSVFACCYKAYLVLYTFSMPTFCQ